MSKDARYIVKINFEGWPEGGPIRKCFAALFFTFLFQYMKWKLALWKTLEIIDA